MWNSFVRIFKMSWQSFKRNGWLSFAAIFVMTLTLFIIIIFVMLSFVLNMAISTVNQKMDISVYLKDDAQQEEVEMLRQEVANMTETKEARYISKKEALDIYKEKNKSKESLLSAFTEDENPLPASLEVKLQDPNKIETVVRVIEQDQFQNIVYKTSYRENRDVIDKLLSVTSYIKKIGFILSFLFIIISLLIIFNTIRIAIYTRRDEIEIMKLVGATSWFIRGSFLFEGIFYGVIATLVTILITYPFLLFFSSSFSKYVGDNSISLIGFYNKNILLFFFIQLLIGVLLGSISSYIALKRYLKIS